MVCSSRIKKGKDHPGYGIKRPMSPQRREKQKGKNKGNLWWNNGKEQVMSPRSLGDDWIRGRLAFNNAGSFKGAAKQRGKKWWNNGYSAVMAKESPGPEWVRGRFVKKVAVDRFHYESPLDRPVP
jgi:hypothetical protein